MYLKVSSDSVAVLCACLTIVEVAEVFEKRFISIQKGFLQHFLQIILLLQSISVQEYSITVSVFVLETFICLKCHLKSKF